MSVEQLSHPAVVGVLLLLLLLLLTQGRSPKLMGHPELTGHPKLIGHPKLMGHLKLMRHPKQMGHPELTGHPKLIGQPKLMGLLKLMRHPKLMGRGGCSSRGSKSHAAVVAAGAVVTRLSELAVVSWWVMRQDVCDSAPPEGGASCTLPAGKLMVMGQDV